MMGRIPKLDGGIFGKMFLAVLLAGLLGCASQQKPPVGAPSHTSANSQESAESKEALEASDLGEDKDPVEALPGNQLFFNFAKGAVCYEQDGVMRSFDLAKMSATNRGNGKAFAAGLTFGLAGFAALPAIYAANTNALKPNEAVALISLFPDRQSFLLSSPLSQRAYQVDLQGNRIRKYKFGGCDPQVQPDGKTVYVSSIRKEDDSKILKIDISTQKQLPFEIEGSLPQSWPRVSPEGKSMMFVEGALPDNTAVILYDLATKARKTLVNGDMKPVHPAWGPDGSFIVYASLADDQIHKLTLDGGHDEALTSTPLFKLYPAVTPDGKAVVFSQAQVGVRSGSIGGRFMLKWFDLETRTIRTLPASDHPHYYSALDPVVW